MTLAVVVLVWLSGFVAGLTTGLFSKRKVER